MFLTNTQIVTGVQINVEREFGSRGFTCVDDERVNLTGKPRHAYFDWTVTVNRRVNLTGSVVIVCGRYQARTLEYRMVSMLTYVLCDALTLRVPSSNTLRDCSKTSQGRQ